MVQSLCTFASSHCRGFSPEGSVLPSFHLSSDPKSAPSSFPISAHSTQRDPIQSPPALRINIFPLTLACWAPPAQAPPALPRPSPLPHPIPITLGTHQAFAHEAAPSWNSLSPAVLKAAPI